MAEPQHDSSAGGTRRNRGLKWLLVGSLALNLLVGGLVIGAVIKGPPPGNHGDMVRDMGFGIFDQALTREDRAHLREAFRKAAPARGDMQRMLRADVDAMMAALRAVPFDPAALDGALALQRQRIDQRMTLGQRLVRDRLLTMTEAERAGFADRLEAALSRRDKPDQGGPDTAMPQKP
jgi:uncharacterized membrane protein